MCKDFRKDGYKGTTEASTQSMGHGEPQVYYRHRIGAWNIISTNDFRSNVSQGSEPEVHEITDKEAEESLRAAKSVDGDIVGVDFIPAKNSLVFKGDILYPDSSHITFE